MDFKYVCFIILVIISLVGIIFLFLYRFAANVIAILTTFGVFIMMLFTGIFLNYIVWTIEPINTT